MDPRLLKFYNYELQFIREMGGEFSREFPKIAGRLGLDEFECADPYVERLLEGFAFLAARIHLKLDAEFPRFTQHLLEIVYPHYLAPTPSMAVVQMQADLDEGSLSAGFPIPRGTPLRSRLGKGEQTACEYRTAHDVTLWPLELTEADYSSRDVVATRLPQKFRQARALLRLRFRATAGVRFDEMSLDSLPIFLRGREQRTMLLYEQLFANAMGALVTWNTPDGQQTQVLDEPIGRIGFEDHEALLPQVPRSFQGYRLLHEYFAFHHRFLFFELAGLANAVRRNKGDQMDILIPFERDQASLESVLNAANFGLFCTPAINLFPQRADRLHLTPKDSENHIVPDRTRPMDFEVHSVTRIDGYGTEAIQRQEFQPFYAATDADAEEGERPAFYTLRRMPRLLSHRQRRLGARSSYVGSEVFVSLVDPNEAPYRHDLSQLDVMTLCTNRDLPLQMPVGKLDTDFTLELGAPVKAIRCVAGPTEPKPSFAFAPGDNVWRLISHLSLNYLSLVDTDPRQGAAALRELLSLYRDIEEPGTQKQIEGIRSVSSSPIVRKLSSRGPLTFGRGLQITVACDESSFEGYGVFLLGAVLSRFFSKYVSINSFTETILRTTTRGEVMRWPAIIGSRQIL